MILLVEYGEIFIFIVLLIMSIVALATGVERAIVFRRNSSNIAESYLTDTADRLRKKDLKGIKNSLNSVQKKNIYHRFTSFALEQYHHGHDALFEMMAGFIIKERISLEKRLSILNTLGNNAPFIGLLGTVLGIIKAFDQLGTLGNTGAELVMKSISRALLATASGLFVAIPVVMANNYFTRKIKTITQSLEFLSREFLASMTSKSAPAVNIKKTARVKKKNIIRSEKAIKSSDIIESVKGV